MFRTGDEGCLDGVGIIGKCCKAMRGAGIAIAAGVLVLLGAARAEEVDWKRGVLGHLAPLIGTYRYDEVLEDPQVRAALGALLPAPALAVLPRNLGVAGPIDFIDGHLVLSGNRPHRGGEDAASVWIKIYDGAVMVVLLQGGKTTLYTEERTYSYLPIQLRAALAAPFVSPLVAAPPPGVTWVR